MPAATLQRVTKDNDKHQKDVSTAQTITHNNARLYYDTDGLVYEHVGLDGSGNRIYRNQDR